MAGALVACAMPVCAQDAKNYPNRPVRLVVPYAPGGTTDFAARLLAAKLAETLGQTVVVDNRPGAGSIIGSDLVAKAIPDGYTLLMVDTGFSVTPALYAKLPFDAGKDFMPVTEAMRVSNWLIVPASLAVIAPKRSAAQPDVPTMAESGYAGVTMTSWYGVMAPTGVPRPLVEKLAGEISKALALPDVKERLATQFAEPVGSTPAAFGKLVIGEIATWTAVAKAGGIKAE